MENKNIIIGTRGSKLALWQAHYLQDQLSAIDVSSELLIIKTKGDKIQNLSFDKIEGKGFFTKEIEEALIGGDIDVAVHSLKDMPTEATPGLSLAGLSYREDPADLLIIRKDAYDAGRPLKLKENAVVGTSSIRRKSQILRFSSSVEIKDLRGNVPTRVGKLANGDYDAIVLAAAGLNRLEIDLSDFETLRLNPKEFNPAPGQGIIVYQSRKEDILVRKMLSKIHHREVSECSNVERKVMMLLGGGCHSPLGVYCEKDKNGNYHAFASFGENPKEMQSCMISQSTHAGLAENIVAELKKTN